MTKYFSALLMLFVAWPSFAADPNNYTAEYECVAGGPNCNVDVAALGARTCDQIITTSTPWSSVNWSNNTICVQAGDHSGKGRLTIPSSANGQPGNYKVLRYYRSGDNNDEPWNQTSGNQAKLKGIIMEGADYWVIHRLTLNGNGTNSHAGLYLTNGNNNIIVNRVLTENYKYSMFIIGENGLSINTPVTIQNSVIRKAIVAVNYENQCIDIRATPNIRIVNNEIYDCNKSIASGDGNPTILGAVFENNDLYTSQAYYTDCNGNYTPNDPDSPCAAQEALISIKAGGSTAQPVKIIHNRLWGARSGDGILMGDYNWGSAPAISISSSPQGYRANYVLVQNNIIWDAQLGISNWWGTVHHVSIIGNLIYNIKKRTNYAVDPITLHDMDRVEVYLNTIIDAPLRWMTLYNTVTNSDLRCNLVINSGGMEGGASSTTQAENNTFYATPLFTTNNQSNNVVRSSVSASFNTDYCFYRKLRTGAERVCIPHARSTSDSPHYRSCTSKLGSRINIGINDSLY